MKMSLFLGNKGAEVNKILFVIVILILVIGFYLMSIDTITHERDNVDIIIENHLDTNIYLNRIVTLRIYKLEEGEWNIINTYGNYSMFNPCLCEKGKNPCDAFCPVFDQPIPTVIELSTGEKIVYDWTEKIYETPDIYCNGRKPQCVEGKEIPIGNYMVKLCYSLDYVRFYKDHEPMKEGNIIRNAVLDEDTKICIEKEFDYPTRESIYIILS